MFHTVSICSVYGIFTYIWVIFRVNVGKYSIHGAFGHSKLLVCQRVTCVFFQKWEITCKLRPKYGLIHWTTWLSFSFVCNSTIQRGVSIPPTEKVVFFGRLRSIHFNRFSLTRSSGVKTPTAFTAGIIGTSRIYREYWWFAEGTQVGSYTNKSS